jgi:hypothetical protein
LLRTRLEEQERAITEFRSAIAETLNNKTVAAELNAAVASVRVAFGDFYADESGALFNKIRELVKAGPTVKRDDDGTSKRTVALLEAMVAMRASTQQDLGAPAFDDGKLFEEALKRQNKKNDG